ncbi:MULTISPECIES: hemerythrin domain-containing protein [Luteimonas]|uniref:Hemerythrin HHE cation-binding protein n=1 Tax=Luteimonas chenhongjianii TaxID=2006110 RepID=A0A290XCG2_9GAMM|nr:MULTISPECIES: hemerythrin domain-containing protein [Luteimonas]ATD66842.1 hemerythrin HHE cation-binding protein [Luteimonas chenhongjianii]RPD84568.1 hemerythrin domain-containing protein [Luteimonas sp. 100069]
MRDILKTLENEHGQLRTLFAAINATTDRAEKKRADLLEKIEAVLVPHAKWEELVFYPAYAERASHDQLLLHAEAIQEHRAVELTVLPDLHASAKNTRQFAGSVKVLSEFITHHADEEEDEMFKAARTLFSPEELADLDEQYEEWKASPAASAVTFHAKAKTAIKSALRNPTAPG